ncbi:Linker for activation of T-cells family member 2 [Scophthalmus maximus]|uniref:Linker for activation of T-cells family member 2 n=1 Tax=Scophthalmus maximus TaxID=52904 RepID=A0A2U9B860_SCOMX|nr:Linker for activation of T-cells family member 2 [Scophthalmus maximus]
MCPAENRTETEDVCFGEVLRVGGCGEVLKEEAQLVLLLVKNEGSWTTEGMSGNSSLLAAVLTVVSVVSLSLLSLLCLRCKRKSKVIHEELQAYDLPTFQRGGSVFAVMQSKPVTRTNQITSTTVEIPEESSAAYESSDYENVKQVCAAAPQRASLEHTYVAPLQIDVYVNEQTKRTVTDAAQPPDVYANFIKSLQIKDDEDDYENSEFLEQTAQQSQDEEPDYVNEDERLIRTIRKHQ